MYNHNCACPQLIDFFFLSRMEWKLKREVLSQVESTAFAPETIMYTDPINGAVYWLF